MKFLHMTVLVVFCCIKSESECLKVVGPDAPLVIKPGKDLILPCSIQPKTSAVDMTVEWYRLNAADVFVHLYENHKDKHKGQDQLYRGRTAIFREELQNGNTSLKLSQIKMSDEGSYKCLIESKSWSDAIIVNVTVEAQGLEPVITVEGYDSSGGIRLLCESSGWEPEPKLFWLDKEGATLTAEATEIHMETDGFRVKRRITVYNSDSDSFFCRLLLKHHKRETKIILSSQVFKFWKSAVISITLFTLVTVGLLVGLFACCSCVIRTQLPYNYNHATRANPPQGQ